MWKQILRNNSILKSKTKCKNVRTFLSKSYSCNDEWNTRLTSSILQKVKVDTFYYDLEQKFQQQGKISAIDLDIYANKVEDGNHADELADLIHKFRMTEETTNSLDSTGHAVVRNFLEFDQIEILLQILNDRISYGIFLDNFTANMALNKFIESKDYKSAAQIATFLMLQEDLDKPITKLLSLYACYQDLKNPIVVEEEVKEEAAPVEKSKKKKEEIKIRVGFIRNEFFDDHFDIRDNNHLVGKTLTMIGKKIDGPIGNGFTILGLCLHQKYSEAVKYIEKNPVLHKDVLDLINENLAKITSEDEDYKKCLTLVSNLQPQTGNVEVEISSLINEAVTKFEKDEIDQQKEVCINIPDFIFYDLLINYFSRFIIPG